MHDDFNNSTLQDINWFIGDIVQDSDGHYVLEWNDPQHGLMLRDEESLAMLKRSAENMLEEMHEPVLQTLFNKQTLSEDDIGKAKAIFTDIAVNADQGLYKLKDYKRKHGITLTTPALPRPPECA